jgi:hypothetical protein
MASVTTGSKESMARTVHHLAASLKFCQTEYPAWDQATLLPKHYMESSSSSVTRSQDHESALLSLATKATIITPDDSSVSALPRGQVDYLSHNWEEEDVWRSWQKMARHHGDVADAVRLENASWRIWWKKKNKLKTVAPETLNWRKDADVTWLYGPLHTAEDWTPLVQPKQENSESAESTQANQPGYKSILKHRTLSELLTNELRPSSYFSPVESQNEGSTPSDNSPSSHGDSRPGVSFLGPSSEEEMATSRSAVRVGGYASQPNTRPSTPSLANRQFNNKKHISFNTVVEQFVAIEKPNLMKPKSKYGDPRSWNYGNEFAVDESNNVEETDETWDGRTRHPILSGCAIADSDSDEDRGSDGEGNDGDTATNQPRTNSPIKKIPQKPVPRPRAVSASAPTSPSCSTPFLPIPRPISPSQLRQKEQVTSAQLSAYGLARRPGIGSPYLPRARLYSASHGESIWRGNEYAYAGAKASPHVRVTVAQIASTSLNDDGKAEGLDGDVVDDPGGSGDVDRRRYLYKSSTL